MPNTIFVNLHNTVLTPILSNLHNAVLIEKVLQYFARHKSDTSLSTLLIYFASHNTADIYTALAQHIHFTLPQLKARDYERTVQELNAIHPQHGGNQILGVLFEHGKLHAINTYIENLPITLCYRDVYGNTILHHLAKACGKIYSYGLDNFLDDERNNDYTRVAELQQARAILTNIAKDKETLSTLTQEAYLENDDAQSVLLLFLNGYNNTLSESETDETDLLFLRDLLVILPRSNILACYNTLHAFCRYDIAKFWKDKLATLLLTDDCIEARRLFHGQPQALISPTELDNDEYNLALSSHTTLLLDNEEYKTESDLYFTYTPPHACLRRVSTNATPESCGSLGSPSPFSPSFRALKIE